MTAQMTQDEMIRALIVQGVPPERAKQLITQSAPTRTNYVQTVGEPLPFPIRFTLPWSCLVTENKRFAAHESRIRETKVYRAAKQRSAGVATVAMTAKDGRLYGPLDRPLALHARVYLPDNRVHDVPNFAGATHNALKGVVYTDDRWLYSATWERAGVDVDAPRAEIEIAVFDNL